MQNQVVYVKICQKVRIGPFKGDVLPVFGQWKISDASVEEIHFAIYKNPFICHDRMGLFSSSSFDSVSSLTKTFL